MAVATTIPEKTMDLPVKFPSETEVILEDVARFRALTPKSEFGRYAVSFGPETTFS